MKEKKWGKRYPESVRRSALERMKLGVNVSELAAELRVNRATLYWWKAQEVGAARAEPADGPADKRDYRIRELEARVAGLEGELGRASLEVRFFNGALRRVEESEPNRLAAGETASMPKSAAGRKRKAD
jgi:transposase-like protein